MKTLFATLLAALLLAGCGSSSDDNANTADQAAPPSSQPAAAASGSTTAVDIKDFDFNPNPATVKVGQKITWTNSDAVAHNVVGGPLKSSTLNQGDTYSYTPTKPGTISYVCTFHAQMKATLKVVS